jgi:hypothetical protein
MPHLNDQPGIPKDQAGTRYEKTAQEQAGLNRARKVHTGKKTKVEWSAKVLHRKNQAGQNQARPPGFEAAQQVFDGGS